MPKQKGATRVMANLYKGLITRTTLVNINTKGRQRGELGIASGVRKEAVFFSCCIDLATGRGSLNR